MINEQSVLAPWYQQQSEFLYYLFDDMYQHLRNIAIGSSTMPMINKTEFEMIEILYPTLDIVDLFEIQMSVFTVKIQLIRQQNDLLQGLIALLLKKITEA